MADHGKAANMATVTRQQLRALRKKLGLSVAAASVQVHVASRTWVRWESGEIPVPEIAAHLFSILNGQPYAPPRARRRRSR